ncbi:MAG: sulfatase-like hydrolase/transferase [Oscillospiraceae bacterium]|nr:sulfatase-like hydrolase/transferase [Oscillospiraceae bacterium]
MKKLRMWMEKINIPAWLFMFCAVVFDEFILHIWTPREFAFPRLVTVLVCAAFFGLVFALLTTIGSSARVSRILALVFSLVFAFFTILEFFIQDSFKTFMILSDIFGNAGDVAGGFGDTLVTLILHGFWRILVVLLPIALYGFLGHLGKWGKTGSWITRVVLAGLLIVSFFAGMLFVRTVSPDSKKYDEEYTFDSAVRAFGLTEALTLDLFRGGNTNTDFVPSEVPTAPTRKTQPSDEPTEPTDVLTEESTEPTEETVAYGVHEFDVDYAVLADEEWNDRIASAHRFVASQTPASENQYTGMFAGKNLILITAEAFTKEVIDPVRTPTLYRMAHEGIYFTDYYQPAWGGSTSTGEFSNLYGIVPTNGVASIKNMIYNNNDLTIGNQLRRQGYFSVSYHNGEYTYYERHRTHQMIGYDNFYAMGNGLEQGVASTWTESDQEMIEYTVPQYIDHQPFSVYYMTISGHCNYSQANNAMSRKNYHVVENEDWSETIKCYHAANIELENAMASLLRMLEDAGIADDTVIVISPDHYPYGLETSYAWSNGQSYMTELYGERVSSCFIRDNTALIIWSGCLEGMNLQVDAPTYSLDILPTLSNLFGVEYDSRMFVGRDVFSDQMPLVLWNDYSWKTEYATYNGATGQFIPAEGYELDEDYKDQIAAIVRNKITFSDIVLECDYYGAVMSHLPGKEEQ